jgi:adenosylcobyric acid synthase
LKAPKVTTLTTFSRQGARGSGYEIHMGQTRRKGGGVLFEVIDRNGLHAGDEDGCIALDSNSMGTYIHGLFDNPEITRFWLAHIGLEDIEITQAEGPEARNREYDLLARHFEKHIDTNGISELIR